MKTININIKVNIDNNRYENYYYFEPRTSDSIFFNLHESAETYIISTNKYLSITAHPEIKTQLTIETVDLANKCLKPIRRIVGLVSTGTQTTKSKVVELIFNLIPIDKRSERILLDFIYNNQRSEKLDEEINALNNLQRVELNAFFETL